MVLALPFLALVLFSFSFPDEVKNNARVSYSGEQLFQGIYFHHGEVAGKLGTISKTTVFDATKELNKGYYDLRERLLQKNPNYFEDFKRDILSRSHITVTEALKKTSVEVFSLLREINLEKNENADKPLVEAANADVTLEVVNVFFVLPVPDMVYVVWISPYIMTPGPIILPLGPPNLPLDENGKKLADQQSQSKLSGEMLINEIVEKL
jgi:SdpC family antimicrobial peptide